MCDNPLQLSKRSSNRKKRSAHNKDQINYLESLPDLQESDSSLTDSADFEFDDQRSSSCQDSDFQHGTDFLDSSEDEIPSLESESNNFYLAIDKKIYCEVLISAMLTKCKLTLSASEMVINLFNNLNIRFSNDPVILPSVRYLWEKRSKMNPIGVYLLCDNQHSHGPFIGEPSKYEPYECDDIEMAPILKNDKYFLHIRLRDQLENHLPTISESDWINNQDQISTFDVSDGKLAKNLRSSYSMNDNNVSRLTLTLHSDEVQAGNSSNLKIFPIFVSINELKPDFRRKNFLLVGLFVGKIKPNVACYLGPICEELKNLEEYPVSWKNKTGVQFKATFHVIGLVADAPMRAFLRGVRQYNHTYGCDWCLIQASTSRGSRVYPILNENEIQQLKRNHDDFVSYERFNENLNIEISQDQLSRFYGIIGGSPLMQLSSFNIVDGIAVEHMHCMVLGIFRSLVLRGWFGETQTNILENKVDRKFLKKELSNRIMEISVPSDITRPPRILDQIKYWKSSEYDAFLVYYAVGLMKGLFKPKVINHLLCFVRIFQLSHHGPINQETVSELKNLIYEFQCGVKDLYGSSFMSYNLHILAHLPDSVVNLGPTKNISSYPLENYMGLLKDKVRRSTNLAQSLVRIFINDFKYCEIMNSISTWPLSDKEKQDFLNDNSKKKEYENLTTIKETDFLELESHISTIIHDTIGEASVSFFKTISINGKRFSTSKYGKDKIRCDSIIKNRDGKFMKIEYLFQSSSLIYAIGHQIETSSVNVNFKGFSGSFIFNLPHIHEIKRNQNKLILISIDQQTKKCFIIPSTKYHYKYQKDFLVEPFLLNF